MRRTIWQWAFAFNLCFGLSPVGASPVRLDIDAAVDRAVAVSRNKTDRTRIELAQANLERSKALLPANPFLSGGAQHTTQTGIGPNYVFLLSQEFEIAGQRTKRIEAATHGLEKASWEGKNAEQNLTAAVKIAFVQALVDADRVTLAHQKADFAGELTRQLEQRKLTSDIQRVDLNVARIEDTRTRRELAAVEQAHERSLAALRRLLALPVGQEIELAGAPEQRVREIPPGPELVARALEHRGDLVALRHAIQQADSQLEVTKREAIPNVTVSGTVSRFEGDTLAGGDVGIPVPLFQRKTADTTEAMAERERFSIEAQSLEREIPQQVMDARRACSSALADLQAMQQEILPRSEENLEMERRLYQRGEVTVSDLIAMQIDLISARRDYLDALQAYNEALIELERVTGEDLKLL
jgi:cobalt-zinc-cadmium efflux system outer membrane protein